MVFLLNCLDFRICLTSRAINCKLFLYKMVVWVFWNGASRREKRAGRMPTILLINAGLCCFFCGLSLSFSLSAWIFHFEKVFQQRNKFVKKFSALMFENCLGFFIFLEMRVDDANVWFQCVNNCLIITIKCWIKCTL